MFMSDWREKQLSAPCKTAQRQFGQHNNLMPVSPSFEKRLHKALPQIIEKFGTPFHIYDEMGVRETLRDMKQTFASAASAFRIVSRILRSIWPHSLMNAAH
jgi:predicted SpoU family rRNA methylase